MKIKASVQAISADSLTSVTGGQLMTPSFGRTVQNQAAWERAYTKGAAESIHPHIKTLPPDRDVNGKW